MTHDMVVFVQVNRTFFFGGGGGEGNLLQLKAFSASVLDVQHISITCQASRYKMLRLMQCAKHCSCKGQVCFLCVCLCEACNMKQNDCVCSIL